MSKLSDTAASVIQWHVLVIEDNEIVADAMRILFESAGYRVSTTGTIAESLGVVRSDPADLVLLDLTLPDGDGLTLIEPLKVAGCRTVVALTGHGEPEIRRRCLDAGCTELFVKPVPVRELLAKSAGWLR